MKPLRVAAFCVLIFTLPTASIAATKQGPGGGSHACHCGCYVTLSNGSRGEQPVNISLPNQYACGTATGLTCNVIDQTSPVFTVATGSLDTCEDGSWHVTVPKGPVGLPITKPVGSAPSR